MTECAIYYLNEISQNFTIYHQFFYHSIAFHFGQLLPIQRRGLP